MNPYYTRSRGEGRGALKSFPPGLDQVEIESRSNLEVIASQVQKDCMLEQRAAGIWMRATPLKLADAGLGSRRMIARVGCNRLTLLSPCPSAEAATQDARFRAQRPIPPSVNRFTANARRPLDTHCQGMRNR